MKSKFIGLFAVLTLALAGSVSAFAQTTQDGPGPSEQPSAPMEIGQPQDQAAQPSDAYPTDSQPADAQPTEAQPGGPTGEEPAKTDKGVGRVSMIHGDVSTQRGDSGDWSAATLNQPVMMGDKVSTGDNARAELQLDFANTLRLGPNSKANFANFTHKDIQVQLSQGLLNYSVSKDSEAEPEIDTPNVSVHPAHHDGVFRVEVRPDGDTLVIVRKGEAQIATPQGSAEVHAGEMATVRGTSDSAQYKISDAPDRDDWDRWNADRDHMIANAQSWHHTNHYYTGAQDLDAYGSWRNVPDYGDVWVPNESADWAPYRDGNWVYEPDYGWTWVGYEPWGWAPYHYGRWMYVDGGWGWWPGPAWGWYRPFWAPAYVSFWGWGAGFGFGVGWGGWGGFGWLPLGPCDWFHPWWGGYRGRFGVVNVTNVHITNITNVNRFGGIAPLHGGTRFSNVNNIHDNHIGRALSTVNASHFGNGRVSGVAASREQIGGARMMAGNLPVVPSRASLSASGRAAAPSTVRNGGSERFFGTHNNVARPASFEQQTSSLRQTMSANHVSGFTAGGRTSGEVSTRGTAMSPVQKPSAGGFSGAQAGGRETGSFGNRSASSGMRPFTPPNSSRSSESRPPGSTTMNARSGFENTPHNNVARPSMPSSNRDGFRPFTPPSQSSRSASGSPSYGSTERGSSGSYWNRTAPSSVGRSSGSYSDGYGRGSSRSSSSASSSYGSSSRPQLDMRQPIAHGPSYGGYGGYSRSTPSYGGSRSTPSYPRSTPNYGGSRPSYSAPRSAPSYSAPRSAPSYGGSHSNSSGGHTSAPSGGGHSSGGGGSHSGHR